MTLATSDYRVTFWTHQLPIEGWSAEAMGWSETTVDLVEVADVREAIQWADDHLQEHFDEGHHSEATYVLYAAIPNGEGASYLRLLGSSPAERA